jgi:hypothetical protein
MAASHNLNFVDAITAGLSAFIRNSRTHAPIEYFVMGLPSPYKNTISITRLSYFSSLFTNASILGFDFTLYVSEKSISPLCHPEDESPDRHSSTSPATQSQPLSHPQNLNIPPSLLPTA